MAEMSKHNTNATGGAGGASGGAGGASGGAGGAGGASSGATEYTSNVLSVEEMTKLKKLLLENISLWDFLTQLNSKSFSTGINGQYLNSVMSCIELSKEELGLEECDFSDTSSGEAVDPTEMLEKRSLILYWEEERDDEDESTCMDAYSYYLRILYYDPENNELLVYINNFWGGSCHGYGNSSGEQIHNYFDWIKLGNTLSFEVSDRTKLDIIRRYGKGGKSKSICGLSNIPIETIKSFL